MGNQGDEDKLKTFWNSLFDMSTLSTCRENDSDLQSVAMLLKKTYSIVETLHVRCKEGEAVRQAPCRRCSELEMEVASCRERLAAAETRMKSIAHIINMGGFTQDSSPRKQQSMAKALTQMLFGEAGEISEDECPPVEVQPRPRRMRTDPDAATPTGVVPRPEVVVVPGSLSPLRRKPPHPAKVAHVVRETLCSQSAAPTDVIFLSDHEEETEAGREPRGMSTPSKRKTPLPQPQSSPILGRKLAGRNLKSRLARQSLNRSMEWKAKEGSPRVSSPVVASRETESPSSKLRPVRDGARFVSCSVSSTPKVSGGMGDETFVSPSLFEESVAVLPVHSPSPGRALNRVVERAIEGDDNSMVVTSSPPLNIDSGAKKSQFTPKLRLSKDKPCLVDVSKMKTPANVGLRDVSNVNTGNVGDETFLSPSLFEVSSPAFSISRSREATRQTNALEAGSLAMRQADFGLIKLTGNREIDNMLDLMCDTRSGSAAPSVVESATPTDPGRKRQADFWKLKPCPTSKEPICSRDGPKFKQLKIGFGVRPERTDLCTLSEFNGGVRQSSQTVTARRGLDAARSDVTAARAFNGGVCREDMVAEYSEEAAFERAILDSLHDAKVQDNDEDVISPSPDLSISRRSLLSQKSKKGRRKILGKSEVLPEEPSVVGNEENCDEDVNTEDLLHRMAVPDKIADLVRNYDNVPKKPDNEPRHRYQRDAVRKRDQRMQLGGWDCAHCREYYEGTVHDPAERKKLMDKCSKHRDKYQRQETPPGYWNPRLPSTPELKERNLDTTQPAPKLRTRKQSSKTEEPVQ